MNLKEHWDELCLKYAGLDIPDHFKVASMAQFILDSGRGTSRLSYQGLNFAGIKWRPEMEEYASPLKVKVPSEDAPVEFCRFHSVEQFMAGYWAFIGRAVYDGWEDCETAAEYIRHLESSGYAADPEYGLKCMSLFEEARKLLNANGADIEGEDRVEEPVCRKPYTVPDFQELPGDIRFDNQGNYRTPTGFASGLVVHYTVSGRTPRTAIAVARWMASEGLGCLVMDGDGIIWFPKDWDWRKQWDDHAGKSSWPSVSGTVSKYFMGMEICCWGAGTEGKDLATITANRVHHNQQPGTYQRFTAAQEESLMNFVLWQADTNPEFDINNVVGHDEVSPGRKIDPGYSLSCSMPEFRDKVRALSGGSNEN